MPEIPHDGTFDSTAAIVADPYGFVGKRCARLGSKLFRTRLLLKTNICAMGRDAAELLCDEEHFMRKNAVLKRFASTLTGTGGVQGMDGESHRHRKQMFTQVITPEEAVRLGAMTADGWRAAARRWSSRDAFPLYNEAREVVCRAVVRWAGVPVAEEEFDRLTYDLAAMYERVDSLFWGYWEGRMIRARRERWMAGLIEDVRAGRPKPPAGSALAEFATHRDLQGQLLLPRIAAVEMLNVLRPVVAVSVFIAQAAHALHEYPECRERCVSGGDEYREWFAQEVRRHYPFFPAVAARVRQDFEWHGYRFPQGMRVILGLYATNHDPDLWDAPDEFRPERFRGWNDDPFSFIPQGGGDRERNHRCPGDRVSVELIKAAVRFLCEEIQYDVPPQDLQLNMRDLPALPRSGVLIKNVRTAVAVG